MTLTIVSPFFTQHHTINWLEVDTPEGNLIIQPGHAPMVVTLTPHNNLTFELSSEEKQKLYLTRPGFLEIQRDQATIIINQ